MSQRVGDLVISLGLDGAQFNREMVTARRQLGGLGGDAASATGQLESMKRSALGLTGILAGALSIGSLIKTADDWGQLSSRMAMATSSAEELAEVQRRLMEISDRTYKPIEEQSELFIRSASAMRELGYSTAGTVDFIDSVSSLLTINAASAQKAESAINALSKSMVQGKVSGENWNTIMEVMPTVAGDIARNMGITETAVKQLASEGRLSMQQFSDAIIAAREENARLAENMPTTVGDAIAKLSNHWKAYIGDANTATGATATLAQGISLLADNLDLVAIAGQSLALGVGVKYLLSLSASVVTATQSTLKLRAAQTAQAEAQLRAAQTAQHKATMARRMAEAEAKAAIDTEKSRLATLALVQARNRETAAINTVTAAQARLNAVSSTSRAIGAGLLGMMGGPIGLAATAIAVGAGFLMMRNDAEEANKSLFDMQRPVDELISKYRSLDTVRRQSFQNELKKDLEAADASLREATDRLKDYAESVVTTWEYTHADVGPVAVIDSASQAALDTFIAALNEVQGSAGGIEDLSGYLQASMDAFADSAAISETARAKLQEVLKAYVEGRLKVEDFTQKLRELTAVSNETADSVRNLGDAGRGVDFSKQINSAALALDVSKLSARGATKEAELLQKTYAAAGTEATALSEDIKRIVSARGNIDVAPGLESLKTFVQMQVKIQENNEEAKKFSESLKSGGSEAKKLNDTFIRMQASQQQQIALHGKTTELAKLHWQMTAGELAALSDEQKLVLASNAAELDRLATMERYKSLVEDLRTPEQKALDTANERLRVLNDANVSAEEHARIQKRIADDMVTEAPKFGGIDASIGGGAGELFKIAEAEKALQEWHSKQLTMLESFYADKEGMEQEHADRIAAINKQLADRQEQIQFASTRAMLSVYGDFTSSAMGLLSAMGEESSGVYKAMFIASKAIAVASAIVSAHVAAAKAREMGPQFGGEALAATTLALGYANAAMIASTAIVGMAHDGIDYVPREGTWLLDRGERVLDARTNNDLSSFLAAQGERSGGIGGGISVHQTIQVSGNGDDALIAAMEEAAQRGAMDGAALARQEMMNDFMTNGQARRLLRQ